jgi:hypothetical protein
MNRLSMLTSIHTGAGLNNTGKSSSTWPNTPTFHIAENLKCSFWDTLLLAKLVIIVFQGTTSLTINSSKSFSAISRDGHAQYELSSEFETAAKESIPGLLTETVNLLLRLKCRQL